MIVSCHPSFSPDPKGFSKHSDLARFLLEFFLQHPSSTPHKELSFSTTTSYLFIRAFRDVLHPCFDRGILVWSLQTTFWQTHFHFILATTLLSMWAHVATIQQFHVFGRKYDPCPPVWCSVFLRGIIPMFRGNNHHIWLPSYSHIGSTNPVWLSVFFIFLGGPIRHLQYPFFYLNNQHKSLQ